MLANTLHAKLRKLGVFTVHLMWSPFLSLSEISNLRNPSVRERRWGETERSWLEKYYTPMLASEKPEKAEKNVLCSISPLTKEQQASLQRARIP